MARRNPSPGLARLQKARAREVGATMMTGRKFQSPPLLALAPQSDHGSAARAETEAFFQYGPPQSFFELSWLALQKARVREVGARTDDRTQSSLPPLSWLAPQSDHGSAACAETEAFFQYGPPQSFFELSWLALQKARQGANFNKPPPLTARSAVRSKARAREVGARVMAGRKFLSPPLLALAPQSDHGSAARAETEAFFQYGPPQSFFELTWLALQKARVREVAQRLMTRRKFLSPSLLWLAPQSDHGSAACAETEAFFQYGPPQSFFELRWLALQKARAREIGATMMTGRKFLSPPLLALAPQSDHGSAACAETEAFFQYGPPQSFFELYKRHACGKLRND